MQSLTRILLTLLSLFILGVPVSAQDSDTESAKPDKPKSYTERYKDFYNPKNYTQNYKERYKSGNYQKYYNQLHKENYESLRHVSGPLRGLSPEVPSPTNNPNESSRNRSGSLRSLSPGFPYSVNSPQEYRDFQYEKRGYAPYENTYTETGDIDDILFAEGKRTNALPHRPNIILPDPLPIGENSPIQRNITPYLFPPYMMQVPIINGATIPMQDLPPKQTTHEKPASLVQSSSDSLTQQNVPENPQENTEAITGQNPSTAQNLPQPVSLPPVVRSPVQLLYDKGIQSFVQRNYPRAEQTFRQLSTMSPGSVYVQFAHGLSLFFSTDYKQSNEVLRRSYELAQEKKVLAPTLDQMQIDPRDFRYHYLKLARHVEKNPKDTDASTLLLLLANSGKTSQ